VTGLLVGVNDGDLNYADPQTCNYTGFKDDPNVPVPRNIRVEGSTFKNNLTGALGINAARWFGLRNNNSPGFESNYINPQAGNVEGGTVFFDRCADKIEIHNNTFLQGGSSYPKTDGLELWGRNIDVRNNLITGYPTEGIGANSVQNLTIQQNNRTLNNNTNPNAPRGGILVWTSGSDGGCDPTPRDTDTVVISGNTSTGNVYGIALDDRGESRNTINNLTISADNTLQTPPLGVAEIVALGTNNIYPQPTTIESGAAPRALEVSPKCSAPNAGQVFRFSVSDKDLPANIRQIEGLFSVPGNDETGVGGPGAPACHFIYFHNVPDDPLLNHKIFLSDPNALYTWSHGPSSVGAGGTDLTNGFCRIRAGLSNYSTESKILKLDLDVQFLSSLADKKHMYFITVDNDGRSSHGGNWKYSGWWATQ